MAKHNKGGRPKGTLNHKNQMIKDMILTALDMVGGAHYLAQQAHDNPVAFCGLVGKVLPIQLAERAIQDGHMVISWGGDTAIVPTTKTIEHAP